MHTAQPTPQRYHPYIAPERAALLLDLEPAPHTPDGAELLRGLKRLFSECSAKGYAGFVPMDRARAVLMASIRRNRRPLNPRAPTDVRFVANAVSVYLETGDALVEDDCLVLPHFAVGNPETGLLYAGDMRRKRQKSKLRHNATQAKRRASALCAVPQNASKPDMRCSKTQFMRMTRPILRHGLLYPAASGDLSRAASRPERATQPSMPNPARVVIRGGPKQPDRRPSQVRGQLASQVMQMHLQHRLKAKGFSKMARLWGIRDRHHAHLERQAQLQAHPPTAVHDVQARFPVKPPPSVSRPASPPAAHPVGRAPKPAAAVACPSLTRRPRVEQPSGPPASVQAPNIPETPFELTYEQRLERLAAMPETEDMTISMEQWTIEQAQADAEAVGWGPHRPTTPRLGSWATEPIPRGRLLTPKFKAELDKQYPWASAISIKVLAKAGGTETTVTAAARNQHRGLSQGKQLGPGAFVSCIKKMASAQWGLPTHMFNPQERPRHAQARFG